MESSHFSTRAGAPWSGGKCHHPKLPHHLIECLAQSRYQKPFFKGSFKPASAFSMFPDKLLWWIPWMRLRTIGSLVTRSCFPLPRAAVVRVGWDRPLRVLGGGLGSQGHKGKKKVERSVHCVSAQPTQPSLHHAGAEPRGETSSSRLTLRDLSQKASLSLQTQVSCSGSQLISQSNVCSMGPSNTRTCWPLLWLNWKSAVIHRQPDWCYLPPALLLSPSPPFFPTPPSPALQG